MILLTGATGFLGRFILAELAKQPQSVRLLVRDASHPNLIPYQEKFDVVVGDVLDVPQLGHAMKDITTVIHGAAIVSFHRKDYAQMKRTNAEGTANVVNCALEAKVQKLVHISSVAAIGRNERQELITESSKWQNSSHNSAYAVSKYMAEKEVYRGIEEGLGAVIANPSVILGPGNWKQGTPDLFRTVAKGMSFYPTGGNALVGGEDVARAILVLMQSNYSSGERFILTSENWSYQRFFTTIAQYLGQKAPKWKMTFPFAYTLGVLNETWERVSGSSFGLSRQIAETVSQTYNYSNTHFCKTFDYSFEPIEAVIQRTCQQYLTENGK